MDIKTKSCTSEPHPDYFCSVAAYNTRQKCDTYAFVRVLDNFKRAWVLGMIGKEEFFSLSTFGKMGDLDPGSHLGWKFKADCYNLQIKNLGGFR